MKFNLIALSSLLVLAAAQDSASTTASLSPEASCAAKCSTNDLCCVAGCYHVPCPNQSQANDSNECVAKCPQGSGTPADATRYAQCEQGCFSTHYFPITGTGVTTAGGATDTSAPSSAEATATGSGATAISGSSTASGSGSTSAGSANSSSSSDGSSSGTSTASSASASSSHNAASHVQLGASAAGVLGLVLAVVAL